MTAIVRDQASELRLLMEAWERSPRVATREAESPPAEARKSARVIAVASGKGGVGKTNIAANAAIRLAQLGRRVVLVDADLGTANVDVIMNVSAPFGLSHVLRRERTLEEIAVPLGPRLRLLAGVSGLVGAADLSAVGREELIAAFSRLCEGCEYLVIDCGAGISSNVVGFACAADEVLLVTTPEPTAMTDAYALLKVLGRGEVRPDVGLVVNQAQSPREAQETADRFGATAARFLGTPVDCAGRIPRDDCVAAAVRRRVPLLFAYPHSPAAAGISALADRLAAGSADRARRAGGRRGSADAPHGFFRRVMDFFC